MLLSRQAPDSPVGRIREAFALLGAIWRFDCTSARLPLMGKASRRLWASRLLGPVLAALPLFLLVLPIELFLPGWLIMPYWFLLGLCLVAGIFLLVSRNCES